MREPRAEPSPRTPPTEHRAPARLVLHKRGEVGGDAERFIAALGKGHVERFRAKNHKKLRRYLIDEGCFDEREVLTSEQIRERIQPHIFSEMQQGLLTQQRVEQLIQQVVRGVTPDGN